MTAESDILMQAGALAPPGAKVLKACYSGANTYSPVFVTQSDDALSRDAIVQALVASGIGNTRAGAMATAMAPRPVYVGSNGKGGHSLVFGPAGSNELSPLNDAKMRSLLSRPSDAFYGDVKTSLVAGSELIVGQYGWSGNCDFGRGGRVSTHPKYPESPADLACPDLPGHRAGWNGYVIIDSLDFWLDAPPELLTAAAVNNVQLLQWNHVEFAASGSTGPALVWLGEGGNVFVIDGKSPVLDPQDSGPRAEITSRVSTMWEVGASRSGASTLFECGATGTAAGANGPTRLPFRYRGDSAVGQHGDLGWGGRYAPAWSRTLSDGGFRKSAAPLVSALGNAALGTALANEAQDTIGSFFPFPMTTVRVGYAWGLPTDFDLICWLIDKQAVQGDVLQLKVSAAYTDYGKDCLSKMLEVVETDANSAAVKARRDVALADLPPDIAYRSAIHDRGLNYKSGTYRDSRLVRDMVAHGGQLSDLLFDNVDDGKPAFTYEALGALCDVAIREKRNRACTVPLVGEPDSAVKAVPLNFSRSGGVVTCAQGEEEILVGSAFMLVGLGVPTSFASPLTKDEVAVEYFKVANWVALENATSARSSTEYCMDEAVGSCELLFDACNDDSVARVLPLLLGWDRHPASSVATCLLLGATPVKTLTATEKTFYG